MKRAVRDAAKLAYLVRLIELGINEVSHYAKEADTALANILIENQALNKLNRIKKVLLLLLPARAIALVATEFRHDSEDGIIASDSVKIHFRRFFCWRNSFSPYQRHKIFNTLAINLLGIG